MKSPSKIVKPQANRSQTRLRRLGKQLLWCLALSFVIESIALAWDAPTNSQLNSTKQYFGIRCSELIELSLEEMKSLIHDRNREHFREFCIPDDLLNCSDYNTYLYQLGFLKRQDAYSCRFVPKRKS